MNTGDLFEQSFVVSSEVYEGFRSLFRDNNPLHTDERYARGKGFQDRVMYGNILNGFLSFIVGECLPVSNVIIHRQEIQFCHPVYLDDTVTFTAEITHISEAAGAVEFRFTVTNQQLTRVAKGRVQVGMLPDALMEAR